MKDLSVYIHIPFCDSKCYYCNFCSGVYSKDLQNTYFVKLKEEIENFDFQPYKIKTIFIGGGTPTSVDAGVLLGVIETLYKKSRFDLSEFTIEGNPHSYTKEKLEKYLEMGVTRFSVGIQSLNDKCLQQIGRAHTAKQGLQCVELLLNTGKRVSADLMVGLPAQTLEIVDNDSKSLLKTGIEHISCYNLMLEEGTVLYDKVMSKSIELPNEDLCVDMYNIVKKNAECYGLKRYETSNFGKKCLHNMAYWKLSDYIGFGVGAHSLINNTRYYNSDNLSRYIEGQEKYIEETLMPLDKLSEYLMLGLRLDEGVDFKYIHNHFEKDVYEKLLSIIKKNEKYLFVNADFFGIKEEFSYISNSIICDFIDFI